MDSAGCPLTRRDQRRRRTHRRGGRFRRAVGPAAADELPGRLGAAIKEAICKSTVKTIAREARKPGSYSWFKGGRCVEHPVLEPEVVTNP
jgi:hypothetical protein